MILCVIFNTTSNQVQTAIECEEVVFLHKSGMFNKFFL